MWAPDSYIIKPVDFEQFITARSATNLEYWLLSISRAVKEA